MWSGAAELCTVRRLFRSALPNCEFCSCLEILLCDALSTLMSTFCQRQDSLALCASPQEKRFLTFGESTVTAVAFKKEGPISPVHKTNNPAMKEPLQSQVLLRGFFSRIEECARGLGGTVGPRLGDRDGDCAGAGATSRAVGRGERQRRGGVTEREGDGGERPKKGRGSD